jgi:hypothetical protein
MKRNKEKSQPYDVCVENKHTVTMVLSFAHLSDPPTFYENIESQICTCHMDDYVVKLKVSV